MFERWFTIEELKSTLRKFAEVIVPLILLLYGECKNVLGTSHKFCQDEIPMDGSCSFWSFVGDYEW